MLAAVNDEQVDLVGNLLQSGQSVPRRLALQRRVEHAGDRVQGLAPQVILHERGPVTVVLECYETTRMAFA